MSNTVGTHPSCVAVDMDQEWSLFDRLPKHWREMIANEPLDVTVRDVYYYLYAKGYSLESAKLELKSWYTANPHYLMAEKAIAWEKHLECMTSTTEATQ